MGGQGHSSEPDLIAIVDCAIDAYGWKRHVSGRAIVDASTFQCCAIARARDHERATRTLNGRQPARMVEMSVTVEQVLDVAHVEPQAADIRHDLRCRLWETAVDQHVPPGRRDQVDAKVRRADVVDIADDIERRKRVIPMPRDRGRADLLH